jgi:pimeloyl-ACP methyl ester carboxylesterase
VDVREVVIDGAPTTFRVAGEGEPVVLVHGLSGSWRWWESILGPLAERHRVHVLDLPRLGRRLTAPELTHWLAGWVEAAALERIDLVGHSLGGLVAAEFAAQEPRRVRRLVLVAPAGIPCGRHLLTRGIRLLGALWDVHDRLPTIAGDAFRAGPLSLLHGAVFASHRDLSAELASVHATTLLVWGDDDRLMPARIASEWHEILPAAQLVRLQCGHVPMWEAPRELVSCLLAFLDDELPDDAGDEVGPGVVHGVRFSGHDDEPAVRQ